jgi:hypothetical protein
VSVEGMRCCVANLDDCEYPNCQQRLTELEAENAGLKRGQEMLVHLHGILSKELFGFETLKYTGDKPTTN